MGAPSRSRYDVIVIGSGIGGLGAAVYLARAGYSVLVAERHYRAGGYAHSFRRRRSYVFDAAVRVVAGADPGGLLHLLIEEAGLAGAIPFLRIKEAYAAHYPGLSVRVPAHVEGFIDAYARIFPSEAANIRALVHEMLRVHDATRKVLFATSPSELLSNEILGRYRSISFHDMLGRFLQDPRAIHSIPALWGYYGVSPSQTSAMFFSYALMRYFVEGLFYVRGSFQTFADAFVAKIRALGGEVLLKSGVERVLVEDGRVKGVVLESGDVASAPIVVGNGDLSRLVHELVGTDRFHPRYLRKLARLTRSLSAFEVFVGTDLPLDRMGIPHESLIYDRFDYDEIYANHKRLAELGTAGLSGVVVSCPSVVDPGLAPPGKHTAVITTLMPYDVGEPWVTAKGRYEEALIARAETAIPGLARHIDFVESGSPATMERFTGNSQGASYGWEQSVEQMAARPALETSVGGLYLAGHWTAFGGGVVSVLLSSYKLAQRIRGERVAGRSQGEAIREAV